MSEAFMNTYHKLPVSFSNGSGAYLFDTEGNRYLDFTSGIAVNCLGHNYPPLVRAISEQAGRVLHVCNYYHNDLSGRFAARLAELCRMKNVFFCNSGAEANEGAIKIARKYSLKKYGPGRHTIITLSGSFHGRTVTTVSATGQDKFHKDFGPFTEGFIFVPPNDISALEAVLAENEKKIAGIFLEPIQGESGVIPLNDDYARRVSEICEERDILLMFDEIQTGLGRTGKFLASEYFNVKPDLVTLAKGLSGGVPVGAVLAGEKTSQVLEPGDHGSTFGGNVLAAAAGLVVLEKVGDPVFLAEISALGERLMSGLNTLAREFPGISGARGRGLMCACDIPGESRIVLENLIAGARCGKTGLLVLQAGPSTLRFLPPYIISREEIDEGLSILRNNLR